MRILLLTLACSLCFLRAAGQADSARTEPPRQAGFRPAQLAAPAVLITAGSFGVCNGALHHLNRNVRQEMGCLRRCYFHADDYLQYAPVLAHVGLGFAGTKGRSSTADRLLSAATAYAAMGLMVNVVKRCVREPRPDTGARNSFPSGHTATAFMGAELVRLEYGNAWGAVCYSCAAAIGLLRLYNNRHWTNDVLAGAGIGILSARIGYWCQPMTHKLLPRKLRETRCTLLPAVVPGTAAGAAFVACF